MLLYFENLDDDDILTFQDSDLGNNAVLKEFKSFYKKVVDIENQLFCYKIEKKQICFCNIRQLIQS